MDLSQASQVYVGDGTRWLPADQVVAGTGSSTRIVWSSVVKLTGTTPYQSRDQLRSALAERGFDYRTITSIPFEMDISGATEVAELFADMAELETIPEIDVSRFDSTMGMFYRAKSLTSAPLVGLSSSVDFRDTIITPESANEIMRRADSVSPRTQEIRFPRTAAGCDPMIAEDKGWDVPAIPGTVHHFSSPGTYYVDIPEWATHIDYYLIGAGGGGASGGRLAGNGNGGNSGNVAERSRELVDYEEERGYPIADDVEVVVGAGGAGGTGNSNSSGSPSEPCFLRYVMPPEGNHLGFIVAEASGGSGTGGAAGGGIPARHVFSQSFPATPSAGTNMDGRTPGGGGGGGTTGGLVGGGGNPGRRGGDGMAWFRFRGDGS